MKTNNRNPLFTGALLFVALLLTFFFLSGMEAAAAAGALVASVGVIAIPDEVRDAFAEIRRGFTDMSTQQKQAVERLEKLNTEHDALQRELDTLRKTALTRGAFQPDISRGRFVSDACARYLASVAIVGAEKHGKLSHFKSADKERILGDCCRTIGMEQKAALTSSDIPLPTDFRAEVVELVWLYGQARKFATVYPLSNSSKLPRLKTSPAFGFIDQAASVSEKSPQFEWVTMNPEKAGGIVRIPSEINSDSIVELGQFIARYIAREMAKFEDTVLFTADGTATYKLMKGVAKAAVDLGKKVTLGATKTAPSDATLADLRSLRRQVSTAALGMGAYYLHASWEQRLVSFNNSTNGQVYVPNGANGATLDGYPLRWVDVLPPYAETANAGALPVIFGALEYEYLGVRSGLAIQTSADVYFATDEIAVRALERFVVGLMADDALAALQLAAA